MRRSKEPVYSEKNQGEGLGRDVWRRKLRHEIRQGGTNGVEGVWMEGHVERKGRGGENASLVRQNRTSGKGRET